MDEKDREILGHLKRNSRTKFVDIAKKMGVSEGRVRQRVNRMIDTGAIKRFTIDCPDAEMEAMVLIKAKTGATRSVAEAAKRVAQRVFEMSGEYDIAALITAPTTDELNTKVDSIRKLNGVLVTNTLVKLIDR